MVKFLDFLMLAEDITQNETPKNEGALVAIIIVSILAGIAICAILVFVLNKFYFTKRRCKKTLKELQKKYEYLHALLTGQDMQYIQRLEFISRTNLLYVDIHSSYFKRSKEIRDTTDLNFQDILSDLGALLEENKIKEFKKYYKEHSAYIRQYENSVNQLNSDLMQIIKPEEEARDASVALKENLRTLKSKYNLNEDHLQFVSLSFERVFDAIDRNFLQFDELIETANYDDANKLLPKIQQVVNQLDKLIDEIPNLVDEYTVNIPHRIDELTSRYKELLEEQKPLAHLEVENKVTYINECVERGIDLIKKLSIGTLKSQAENINNEIDKIFESFDKEVSASEEFERKKGNVLKTFGAYEQEYIKITHSIDKFRKVYVVDDVHEQNLKDLRQQLDIVSRDKRRLDVYIFSISESPYTVLIEKVNVLEKGTNEFGAKVDAFRNYLASLKNDSESAAANLKIKFEQLKNTERIIRDWKIEGFVENYKSRFDECYNLIDQCYGLLKNVPINVNEVNLIITELNETTNNLVKEIQELDTYKERASEQILLANRDRMKFSEVNNLLQQCETLYFSGDFKTAYQSSDSILKKLNNRDGK